MDNRNGKKESSRRVEIGGQEYTVTKGGSLVKGQDGTRQIEICGVEYTVTRGALPEGTIGECDPDNKMITVSHLASPEMYETTVLHECVHAGFTASGLEHLVSAEMQEAIVCMVEHTLFNAGFRLDTNNGGV